MLSGTIDVPSGTVDAPIVIRGNSATTLTGTLRLASHVRVEGISFISDGTHAWVEGEAGSRQVAFVGNAFDINCMNCGDAFFGMVLPGDEHLFCGNRVGWWLGDTQTTPQSTPCLLASICDFSLLLSLAPPPSRPRRRLRERERPRRRRA